MSDEEPDAIAGRSVREFRRADCLIQGIVKAMKCPSCGEATLVRDTRDLLYTYNGETTTIPGVRGSFCPACGESVLTAAESSRVSTAMLEFNK